MHHKRIAADRAARVGKKRAPCRNHVRFATDAFLDVFEMRCDFGRHALRREVNNILLRVLLLNQQSFVLHFLLDPSVLHTNMSRSAMPYGNTIPSAAVESVWTLALIALPNLQPWK